MSGVSAARAALAAADDLGMTDGSGAFGAQGRLAGPARRDDGHVCAAAAEPVTVGSWAAHAWRCGVSTRAWRGAVPTRARRSVDQLPQGRHQRPEITRQFTRQPGRQPGGELRRQLARKTARKATGKAGGKAAGQVARKAEGRRGSGAAGAAARVRLVVRGVPASRGHQHDDEDGSGGDKQYEDDEKGVPTPSGAARRPGRRRGRPTASARPVVGSEAGVGRSGTARRRRTPRRSGRLGRYGRHGHGVQRRGDQPRARAPRAS